MTLGPYALSEGASPATILTPAVLTQAFGAAAQQKSPYLQFPYAKTVRDGEKRVILLAVNRNTDSLGSDEAFATLRSADKGKTWQLLKKSVPMSSAYEDGHGGVLSFNFRSDPTASESVRTVKTWSSSDSGGTWREGTSEIRSPFPLQTAYFYRDVLPSRDGRELLASVYGHRKGSKSLEVWLAKSTDRGAHWKIVTTVLSEEKLGWVNGKDYAAEGFDEPSLARLEDGRLMMVARQSAPINPQICRGRPEGLELVSVLSSDEGASWGDLDQMADVGDGKAYMGADPHLLQTSRGLLLSVGRPNTAVLRPFGGNMPRTLDPRTFGWEAVSVFAPPVTSGYTSLAEVSPGEVLQFGDYGSNWCYPAASVASEQGIWVRKLSIPPVKQPQE